MYLSYFGPMLALIISSLTKRISGSKKACIFFGAYLFFLYPLAVAISKNRINNRINQHDRIQINNNDIKYNHNNIPYPSLHANQIRPHRGRIQINYSVPSDVKIQSLLYRQIICTLTPPVIRDTIIARIQNTFNTEISPLRLVSDAPGSFPISWILRLCEEPRNILKGSTTSPLSAPETAMRNPL